jgi:hypothetical protein
LLRQGVGDLAPAGQILAGCQYRHVRPFRNPSPSAENRFTGG